jgi:ribosome-associated toxin RatA of RatAB toxin-antitoxin module
MEIELEEGPFDRLDGRWTFTPLGDEGSRVELSLEYTLASRAIGQLLAPVFGQIMETLVDSFVERANVTR